MQKYHSTKELKKRKWLPLFFFGLFNLVFLTFTQGMEDKRADHDHGEEKTSNSFNTSEDQTPFSEMGLSDEVLLNIFGFLSPKELGTIPLLNRKIHSLADDNALWEKHLPDSQRIGDSYKTMFKELCLNPILFQLYNNFQASVDLRIGYKYTSDAEVKEDMSSLIHIQHNELAILRKNDFSEDRRNDIQFSHCIYSLMAPGPIMMPLPNGGFFIDRNPSPQLIRIDFKHGLLSLGECLVVSRVHKDGYTMMDFRTILPLQ